MKILESFGGVALMAGFFCYFFAGAIIVWAPWMLTNADEATVIDIHGNKVDVAPYTAEEASGRDVYINQVCWHCHSQFVRPVNNEEYRWGPVSQPGESAIDTPHLYSTRRIGPDLAREGWRRVDDWHIAHLYNPRYTVKASVMPAFPWLFKDYPWHDDVDALIAKLDSDGDGVVSPKGDFDSREFWPADRVEDLLKMMKSDRYDTGGVLEPQAKQTGDGSDIWLDADGNRAYENVFTGEDSGDGLLSNYDSRPRITRDGRDLVTYLQRLGVSIGPWRKPVPPVHAVRADPPPMKGVEVEYEAAVGDNEWETRTAKIGDGMMPQRDNAARRYGYHRTNATPEALRESANYTREYDALMAAWRDANPAWDKRLTQGKALFDQHCAVCHGDEGRGNGDASAFLLVRPRNFTLGVYRYRSTTYASMPLDGDIFRTLYRGLPGSSMPSWREKLTEDQMWLVVDYVKSLRESKRGDYGKPWNDVAKTVPVPAVPRIAAEEYDDLVARGRAVYMAMNCNNCHGTEGRGDGPGWNTQTKDNGGVIRPRDFVPRNERDIVALRYRGGATPEDLFRTIYTGLAGAGMPPAEMDKKFDEADALAQLKADGAPQDQIDAAAMVARQKLFHPLKEGIDGVVSGKDENGADAEFIESFRRTYERRNRLFMGDDWALVLYVRHLSGLGWPYMLEEEDE